MQRVADIIVEELFHLGLSQVFMVTGGGAMHLNDAFGRRRRDMRLFFNHHEQACAMGAESYCRLSGTPAIVNVTTGPGGINALNGVYGAYVDSIAMVVISGQIKRDTMARNYPLPLRQLGDQEVDIISMVKPITKYAVELQDPYRVREVVDKAVYLARTGRPGPVWLDIPMDIQGTMIDETLAIPWNSEAPGALMALRGDVELNPNTLGDFDICSGAGLARQAEEIVRHLQKAKRPVLLAGSGVRIAGCHNDFLHLAELLRIPAVSGWNAYDAIPNAHPCFCGRPGTVGDRPGNFTVQNADFLLTLGCRLNIRQISYNWQAFAPNAWKAQVDVDPAELGKPTLNTDFPVHADLRAFFPLLRKALGVWSPKPEHTAYLKWCRERVARYPVIQPSHKKPGKVNPYYFMDRLFFHLSPDDVVITANGSACVTSFQAGIIKENTRLFTNSGDASMGYDLPAAIGAALTGKSRRIICLAGDGSIMMNIQELSSIVGNRLPIIIFELNNNGYHSIRQTQQAYFPDNLVGLDPSTGVYFPNFIDIAKSFGLIGSVIDSNQSLDDTLATVLSMDGPAFYEVILDENQMFEPKTASRKLPDGTMVTPPLDDMAPFLSKIEMAQNRLD